MNGMIRYMRDIIWKTALTFVDVCELTFATVKINDL